MLNLFSVNALPHWEERQIRLREQFIHHFAFDTVAFLRAGNPAWDVRRVEAPTLVPRSLISSAYANDDIFVQEKLAPTDSELVLRPETTPGSYAYMQHLLTNHSKTRLPLCVWQAGRSYRREQDQVSKNMRLKEFWQQEFQCAFSADSANDYHAAALEPVRKMIASMINLPTRLVTSDRLPAYSRSTIDVEVDNGFKWMEIASISLRTDFPDKVRVTTKKSEDRMLDVLVLEIAIGLDRCVLNFQIAEEMA